MNKEKDDIFFAIKKIKDKKTNKNWILRNIDNFDLERKNNSGQNALMYILDVGHSEKLGFTKKDIIFLLNKFNLEQKDYAGWSVLLYIIYSNDYYSFTNKEIISLLDRFNLKDVDVLNRNALMYLIKYNKEKNLKFTTKKFFSILERFDLNKKNYEDFGIYEYMTNLYSYCTTKKDIVALITKLDIEYKKYEKNVFVENLKKGLKFDNPEIIKKIIETDNQEIINCVYKHIYQIRWTHDELLQFLAKNKLEINKRISSLFISSQ